MNELPNREEIRRLASERTTLAVTISMPTHRVLRAARQGSVVLSRLLDEAAAELEQRGHSLAELADAFAEARALVGDELFWQHQLDGLVLYLSPDGLTRVRLPYEVAESVSVGDRFAVRPLVRLWSDDVWFHVLALSLARTRLFLASRHDIRELPHGNLPDGLRTIDFGDHQEHLQFHTSSQGHMDASVRGGYFSGNRQKIMNNAMFFGQGYGSDDHKDDITRYCQIVDDGVRGLTGDQQLPLVVAAVDFVGSIYKRVTRHPDVAGIAPGNPDELSNEELRDRAFAVVEKRLHERQDELASRLITAAAKGGGSTDLAEVLGAARDGRVMTLLVDPERPQWGAFDFDQRRLELANGQHDGFEDLTDLAVALTIDNGGEVIARPPDEDLPVGALFRY